MKRHTRESIIKTYSSYKSRKRQEWNGEYQKVLRALNTAAGNGTLNCEVSMHYDLSALNAAWESDLVKYMQRTLTEENFAHTVNSSSQTLCVWIELEGAVASTSSEEDPVGALHAVKVLSQ